MAYIIYILKSIILEYDIYIPLRVCAIAYLLIHIHTASVFSRIAFKLYFWVNQQFHIYVSNNLCIHDYTQCFPLNCKLSCYILAG